MDLTPEAFEDLIGAYALDACEPDEVAAIDAYVAAHPEAAAEVERLREAAAALGCGRCAAAAATDCATGCCTPRPIASRR